MERQLHLLRRVMLALVCLTASMQSMAQSLTWTSGVTSNDQATGFKWFGVKTPSTASKYELSAITLELVNGSKTTDQTDSYLAIATAATSPTSVPESDVIAVSSNHLQPTAKANYTYNFASPVELNGNTTYYLYWVGSNTATNGSFTAVGQRATVRNSTTYTPGVYLSSKRTDLTPVFTAELSYRTSETWTTGVTANDQASPFMWYGVQTPSTATKYQLSDITIRLTSGGGSSDSYLAIATAATSPSSVPESDVIAVSTNHLQPTSEADYTYTFDPEVELNGNTTYYLYWVSSNTATNGSFTAPGQRARVRNSTTYTPGVYLSGMRTDLTPVFSTALYYNTSDVNQTTFTVTTIPACDATFTWNGQTVMGTSATFTNDGTEVTGTAANVTITPTAYYTQLDPSQTITWDGTATGSAEVKMLADVFSTTYGEKWVRIDYSPDPSYAWHIAAANDYEGATPKRVSVTTEFDEGYIFCFVGTPQSFKIYSKLAGDGYAMTTDGTNSPDATNATAIYLTSNVSGAKNWTIDDTYLTSTANSPGFVIHDTDANGQYGANPFAKYDYALRYWNAEGAQSHWLLQPYSTDELFSGHYGEKWVKMIFSRNTGYHWSVASASDVPKCTTNAAPIDGNLFCFVGTADRFKIYNKTVGQSKAMTTSEAALSSYATFVAASAADYWTLGASRTNTDANQNDGSGQTTGRPIYRYGASSSNISLNAYQGVGKQLAYWQVTDGGSLWTPQLYEPADLDIFCENYGDKWVRITYATSNKYCLMVTPKTTLSYDGAMVRNGRTDMSHEGQLWCFVGTSAGFKLYNRAAGSGYAAATGATLNGTKPLVLVPVANAEDFVIQNSVCLSSKSDLSMGVAPIGSNGSPAGAEYKVGFMSSSNSKCSYLFEEVGATFDISLTGLPTTLPVTHDHVGRGAVTFPIDGSTRQMSYTLTPSQHTLFLPEAGTLSFTKPTCWIGFTFNGFSLNGGTASTTISGVNSATATLTADFTESNSEVRYIAYDSDERDIPYRIPSIARAKNGDLIAMYDLRYNEGDIGYYDRGYYHYRIDLVMKVSKDNGVTWSEEKPVLTGDNSGRFTAAFGDAALVADRDRNLMMLLCAAGNTGFGTAVKMSRCYLQLNETSGEWEIGYLDASGNFVKGDPEDITDYMNGLTTKGGLSTGVYSAFCGSGRFSQSRIYKKDDYYRVYFTAIVKTSDSSGTWGQNGNITYYSDDFGQTWSILGERAAFVNSDEPKCDELPNGDIWMSGRAANGRNFNVYHFTDIATGAGSWLNRVHTNSVTNGIYSSENACNGDIILVKAQRVSDSKPVTLALVSAPGRSNFSDPVWGATGRRYVTIYYKALVSESDYNTTEALASNWEGYNASTAFLVSDHNSAYSSMCMMADGRIGFFLEDDVVTSTAPWSHLDMVFIPYSIETITGGKYTDGYKLSIGTPGLSTMFLDYPVIVPEGASAYWANQEAENGVITMTKAEGIIPASEGVVVSGTAGNTVHMVESYTWPTELTNNHLTGVFDADTEVTAGANDYYYALNTKDGKPGFFVPKGATPSQPNDMTFTMKARKAYLLLSAPLSAVRGLELDFDDVTGIGSATLNPADNANWYDLQGRRVSNPRNGGVYIHGDKKVIMR